MSTDDFYELFKEFKNDKENSEQFNRIKERFMPLLLKYANKLHFENQNITIYEFVNDLTTELYFSSLKIPIQMEHFKEDKYILAYIKKCVISAYIKLNKSSKVYSSHITLDENLVNNNCDNIFYDDFNYNLQIEFILKKLSEKEKIIFIGKYINKYSNSEIAKYMKISRQAVNRRVLKLVNRLRELLSSD